MSRKKREPKAAPDWKPERFARFWESYPRGEDKQAAIREWDKLQHAVSRLAAGHWHPLCLPVAQAPALGG